MTSKSSNTNKIAAHPRCHHRFANGMRCTLPTSSPDAPFCSRHAKLAQNEPAEQDLSEFILKDSQELQTAQGVSYSLASIFELLPQNRISARRAAVLAYIGSLLLRTHACIDREQALNAEDTPIHIDFGDLPRPKRNLPPAHNQTGPKRSAESLPEPDPTKKPS